MADVRVDHVNFSSLNELSGYLRRKKPLLIILDFRYYNEDMVQKLSSISKLIIFDSLKPFNTQRSVIYFNPTTPIKYKYLSENNFIYEGIEYLPLNKQLVKYLDKKPAKSNAVYIGFGNSDPNKLSLKILKILKITGTNKKIILNIGKYFNTRYRLALIKFLFENFKDHRIVENKENIMDELSQCDFLITSFSITALEGLLLSRKVGLYNNSSYHRKLSGSFTPFYYLGTYPFSFNFQLKHRLKKFLSNTAYKSFIEGKNNNRNIIEIISKAAGTVPLPKKILNCPVCSSKKIKLILNQLEKQIFHCGDCKSKFLNTAREKDPSEIYQNAYFNEEYRKQYGKTYLEDRDNILKLAARRLETISNLIKGEIKNKTILDAGCAYGFFLEKARSFSLNPTGIEIEKNAVKYIKNKLKIRIINGNFLDHHFNEKYDVITFWYVLEHFPDPEVVINKILKILKPGGLLCLAVPGGNSPFYRFNKKEWLRFYPEDHFFYYSEKGINILLKRKGFKLLRTRPAGFHPERYKNCPAFLLPLLKLTGQGDTMELYFKLKK